MQLKTFTAPSLPEAMALVRNTLGSDAIILNEQSGANGGVTLTAAREMPAADFDSDVVPESPVDTSAVFNIEQVLRFHRMTPGLRERLQVAASAAFGDADTRLAQALDGHLDFEGLSLQPDRPLLLFGSHGSGKTTTAAKLCAAARLRGDRACLISLDAKTTGARERAAALTGAMDAQHCVAEDMAEIAAALADHRGKSLCVVETPSIAPFDDRQRQSLEARLKRIEGERILVQRAGLDAFEASEEAAAFAELGVRRMIVSKIDLSRRLGGSLTGLDLAGLTLTAVSQSASIGDLMVDPSPRSLATAMIASARGANSLLFEDSKP